MYPPLLQPTTREKESDDDPWNPGADAWDTDSTYHATPAGRLPETNSAGQKIRYKRLKRLLRAREDLDMAYPLTAAVAALSVIWAKEDLILA